VRLIVPFPPGGSNDIVARMIGNELTGKLGQQVIVDNRGGAVGNIGSEIAAKSAPDGYTLLIVSVAYAYDPSIYKSRLKFEPEKSFVPVAMLETGPNVLAVNPKVPVNSVKELVAMAKAKPGAVAYATARLRSFQHLGSEMFRLKAGVDMLHVPIKGGGPAMADVIAGNTQVVIGSLLQTISFIPREDSCRRRHPEEIRDPGRRSPVQGSRRVREVHPGRDRKKGARWCGTRASNPNNGTGLVR